MAKIERLHDSGALGKAATRLAVGKTGGPLNIATVSAIASGLCASRWAISDAGSITLASTLWTRAAQHNVR